MVSTYLNYSNTNINDYDDDDDRNLNKLYCFACIYS